MSSRNGIGALLRRGKCQAARRSFTTSASRGNARPAGQGYTPNIGKSWSSRGVLAVAGAAGILGWGVAMAQKGDGKGSESAFLSGSKREQRYATIPEMEKVSNPPRGVWTCN